MAKAKPFIKWAGGKGQLLDQLDAYLPEEFGERRNITYIEPFVGGGAMLFYNVTAIPYGAYKRTCLFGKDGINYIIIRNYQNQQLWLKGV